MRSTSALLRGSIKERQLCHRLPHGWEGYELLIGFRFRQQTATSHFPQYGLSKIAMWIWKTSAPQEILRKSESCRQDDPEDNHGQF